jgi:hypothetical protein
MPPQCNKSKSFIVTPQFALFIKEKRAARGCKRPKSREETPKEGSGNARRYRTAIRWQGVQKNASDADLFSMPHMQVCVSLATGGSFWFFSQSGKFIYEINGLYSASGA